MIIERQSYATSSISELVKSLVFVEATAEQAEACFDMFGGLLFVRNGQYAHVQPEEKLLSLLRAKGIFPERSDWIVHLDPHIEFGTATLGDHEITIEEYRSSLHWKIGDMIVNQVFFDDEGLSVENLRENLYLAGIDPQRFSDADLNVVLFTIEGEKT